MRRLMLALAFTATAAVATPALAPAQAAPATAAATRPAARPQDVASLDALIGALYDVISGEKGAKRDWDRFRSLFIPGARLIPIGRRPGDSLAVTRVWDVEDYIKVAGPSLEGGGFFEREVSQRTDRYGGMVQRFSTYESRRSASDAAPFARGINSIQCLYDGKRWWVVTIYWEQESPQNPIPATFLVK